MLRLMIVLLPTRGTRLSFTADRPSTFFSSSSKADPSPPPPLTLDSLCFCYYIMYIPTYLPRRVMSQKEGLTDLRKQAV